MEKNWRPELRACWLCIHPIHPSIQFWGHRAGLLLVLKLVLTFVVSILFLPAGRQDPPQRRATLKDPSSLRELCSTPAKGEPPRCRQPSFSVHLAFILPGDVKPNHTKVS